MILKAKVEYTNEFGTLQPGATTAKWKGVPEERLQKMLKDFPEWFEVVGDCVPKESSVKPPADDFVVETQEAKMAKARKK